MFEGEPTILASIIYGDSGENYKDLLEEYTHVSLIPMKYNDKELYWTKVGRDQSKSMIFIREGKKYIFAKFRGTYFASRSCYYDTKNNIYGQTGDK